MCLKAGRPVDHVPEPFAAIILCTADPAKVDYRTRSKWSRALRYSARFKRRKEALTVFMKRKGGINRCAARFVHRLGRGGQKSPHPALPKDIQLVFAGSLNSELRWALFHHDR
jgi:hypothetical protein